MGFPIGDIAAVAPKAYVKYVEPFFSDGDLFMTLKPQEAVVASDDQEFVDLLRAIAENEGGEFPDEAARLGGQARLRALSGLLANAKILCGDYFLVLEHYASIGDTVFFAPPETFGLLEHVELSRSVMKLYDTGCNVLLTTPDRPYIHELYSRFEILVKDESALVMIP